MSTSEDEREQKIHELLAVYASTVKRLSDEALVALHREHVHRYADELVAITQKELDWRGLAVD